MCVPSPIVLLAFALLSALTTATHGRPLDSVHSSVEEGSDVSPLLLNQSAPLWYTHRRLREKNLADPIVDVLRVVYAAALTKEAMDAEEQSKQVDTDLTRYNRHYMFATLALQLDKYGSIQNLTRVLEEDAELAEMEQQKKTST